jgi:hypothetical protein
MDIERQRELNRAKVARFYERHPRYKSSRAKLKRWRNPRYTAGLASGLFRTYELVDPRDEDRLPRVIGYCKTTTAPVWSDLWALRDISLSRWAQWFRELAALGLVPQERFGWAFGTVLAINNELAHDLVHDRIGQISMLTTGDPCRPPPWLLRTIEGQTKGARKQPVGRLLPDGRVEHFRCLIEAARATGISSCLPLHKLIYIAATDSRGCIWFDD